MKNSESSVYLKRLKAADQMELFGFSKCQVKGKSDLKALPFLLLLLLVFTVKCRNDGIFFLL